MSTPSCCAQHTTTCGHLDVCCDHCPSLRESYPGLLVGALAGVALLVLLALGLS